MRNSKKIQLPATENIYRLRIDSRTIITVKSKEALRFWKEKYPTAVEIH